MEAKKSPLYSSMHGGKPCVALDITNLTSNRVGIKYVFDYKIFSYFSKKKKKKAVFLHTVPLKIQCLVNYVSFEQLSPDK